MGQYYLKLPKMGESVAEATVTKWLKDVGDSVSLDDPILEIATDKVDTDVTSEVEGVILEKKFKENEVVQVGEVLVIIETKGDEKESIDTSKIEVLVPENSTYENDDSESVVTKLEEEIQIIETTVNKTIGNSERFYSPLVKNIAKKEEVSLEELDKIPGTGKDHRLTKKDLLEYLKVRTNSTFEHKDQKNISLKLLSYLH